MFEEISNALKRINTPFYIYDTRVIYEKIKTLRESFSGSVELFFAVKANSSIAILRFLNKHNIGAEVVSPGEIFIALKAGIPSYKILYDSLARKEEEILFAIRKGIRFFNFESIGQAKLLEKCAKKTKQKLFVFARINPGIFPKTHSHLSTGSSWSKFGIPIKDINKIVEVVKDFEHIELLGLHCHIGSQILTPEPYLKSLKKIENSIKILNKEGLAIKYVNLGGGFGVPYKEGEKTFSPISLTEKYKEFSKKYGIKIFLELGRFFVAEAGFIITSIIDVKEREGKPLYVVDSGMNDNPRPAIYDAYHHIEPLFKKEGKRYLSRVVGPICENSDEFGTYSLPKLKEGDLLIIYNCGAYTRTMASNYNGRPFPPEYLYNGKKLKKIRKGQRLRELIKNERF
ncbi:MAG: diaminopimelate decarboxylase [candidate division WOR-3 bacterium]